MNQLGLKFRLIFVPFLVVFLATTLCYTFLHWLLLIKLGLFRLEEDTVNIFIPLGLVWIPVILWLRPRIKLLDLKSDGRRDPVFFLLLLIWASITLPLVIAQNYLITASGELTELKLISQIKETPPTKYYTAKYYYSGKRFVHVKTFFSVSGKGNTNFDMSVYAAVPLFNHLYPDTNIIANLRKRLGEGLVILNGKLSTAKAVNALPADSIQAMRYLNATMVMPMYGDAGKSGAIAVATTGYKMKRQPPQKLAPSAWLAVKYRHSISNRLPESEKQSRYREFLKDAQSQFNNTTLDSFIYLDRLPYGKEKNKYLEAINTYPDVAIGERIILYPVFESFDNRNGNKLPWVFGSFGIGAGLFFIILSFLKLKPDAKTALAKSEASAAARYLKTALIPKRDFVITHTVAGINILMFILMVLAGLGFISFEATDLLRWGGNYRPLVSGGQYWRLLTNIFLHGGLLHVLFNMYGLIFAGIYLEPLLGKYKFAALYFVTGILASVASIGWHPATVSVGASGAIFGLYGALLALLTTDIFHPDFKKAFLINTIFFIAFNLLYGLTGGIDNAAHIGGLVSGLLFGYALYPSLKDKQDDDEEAEELAEELEAKHKDYVAQRDFHLTTINIDGEDFSDMESFYNEVDRLFTKDLTWKTGHNLNALNDLLRGGFGVYDYHEPIKLIWKNFAKSQEDLGHEMMDAIVGIIDEHDHIDFYRE